MDNVFNVHDPLYSNVNCLPLPPSAQFNRQRSDSSLAEAERAPDSPQELEKLDEGGKSSCISLASCAGGKRPCHGMISGRLPAVL